MARKSSSRRKRAMEDWASDPFSRFLDYSEELQQLLHLSMAGISTLRGIPRALEVLGEVDDEKKVRPERLEDARKQAELAQREIDNGFPLLHAQAVVSLWGALEALLHDFLAAWLAYQPDARQVEAVRRLRIRFWEYESMELDERCLHTIALLERELGSTARYGLSRFEGLLAPFGLAGHVEEEESKIFFEMNHVRNVLVHRGGIADKRIVDACPWLEVKQGEHVIVTHEAFGRYIEASVQYVTKVIKRVRSSAGLAELDAE